MKEQWAFQVYGSFEQESELRKNSRGKQSLKLCLKFTFLYNKQYSIPFSFLCYLGEEFLEPLPLGEGLQGLWLPKGSCTLQGKEFWREAFLCLNGKRRKATLKLSAFVCSAMKRESLTHVLLIAIDR